MCTGAKKQSITLEIRKNPYGEKIAKVVRTTNFKDYLPGEKLNTAQVDWIMQTRNLTVNFVEGKD